MHDAALLRALTALTSEEHGRVVEVLDHWLNPYASSFPSEIANCRWADGSERPLLIKEHIEGIHDGHGYWEGAEYEATIYRCVLAGLELDTPEYLGSWSDSSTGQHGVAIEYVDGLRLGKAPVGRLVDAARWAASLHVGASPRAGADSLVRRYDEFYFRGWSGRAREFIQQVRPDSPWLSLSFATSKKPVSRP